MEVVEAMNESRGSCSYFRFPPSLARFRPSVCPSTQLPTHTTRLSHPLLPPTHRFPPSLAPFRPPSYPPTPAFYTSRLSLPPTPSTHTQIPALARSLPSIRQSTQLPTHTTRLSHPNNPLPSVHPATHPHQQALPPISFHPHTDSHPNPLQSVHPIPFSPSTQPPSVHPPNPASHPLTPAGSPTHPPTHTYIFPSTRSILPFPPIPLHPSTWYTVHLFHFSLSILSTQPAHTRPFHHK
ncbi:hypothetical protein Pcinc_043518 [Petrolisthes cinctipes]|uniref:Uncharacterized protein n=1 Tax=Petrolisthes cinctipes TaxID=88211 RepID=A0AAE1BGH8_PETCI|nr:hypothetical protein Pcinc_043518 [Petrolisthes cinctipes]